jgi:hypothetical protein
MSIRNGPPSIITVALPSDRNSISDRNANIIATDQNGHPNQVDVILDFAMNNTFTINTRLQHTFYESLLNVWRAMGITLIAYSKNCYKSNTKKRYTTVKRKGRKEKVLHNEEARILCLGGENPLVYILDRAEYLQSVGSVISPDRSAWPLSVKSLEEIPCSLLQSLSVHDMWPFKNAKNETVRSVETTVGSSRIRLCRTVESYRTSDLDRIGDSDESFGASVGSDANQRMEYSSDRNYDTMSEVGSLAEYIREKNMKSLGLLDPAHRLYGIDSQGNRIRLDGEATVCGDSTVHTLHPYTYSAIVFHEAVRLELECDNTKLKALDYYRLLKESLLGILTIRNPYSLAKHRSSDSESETILNEIEHSKDELVRYAFNPNSIPQHIISAFYDFSDLLYSKHKSPLHIACNRKGRLVSVENVVTEDTSNPGTRTIRFKRKDASPCDLHTTISILRTRFDDLLHGEECIVDFDSEHTTLHCSEQFHKCIQRYILPMLCTHPHFLARGKYPVPLYPILVSNIMGTSPVRADDSDEDAEFRRIIYSMKSILRFYDKSRGVFDRDMWPKVEDKRVAVNLFRNVLPKIVERLTDGGDRQTILDLLVHPYTDYHQLWSKTTNKNRLTKNKLREHLANLDSQGAKSTSTSTTSKLQKREIVGGIREGRSNIYTALKSFCYVKCGKVIRWRSVDTMLCLFQDKDKANLLQSKYAEQYHFLLVLAQRYEESPISEHVEIPEGEWEEVSKLYELCASDDIPTHIGNEMFLSMGSKVAIGVPLYFSMSHPNFEQMSNVSFKLMDQYTTANDAKKAHPFYIFVQCMEELSYQSLDHNDPHYRGNKKKMFDWYTGTMEQSEETYPLDFDEEKHEPIYARNTFPIWPSEILVQNSMRCHTRDKKHGEGEVAPFVGAHRDLLDCIVTDPIDTVSCI